MRGPSRASSYGTSGASSWSAMLPAARMAKLLGRALHGGAEMPRAWIECAPKHGESPRRTASKPRSTDPKRVAGGRAGRLCGQAPHGGPRHREAEDRVE